MSSDFELPQNASLLVILTGALGDVARGLIVPSVLKKHRPDIKITWVVESRWSPVVELCSAVDQIVCFDRKNPIGGFRSLYAELKQKGPFDVSFDLQRHFKSGCFTFCGGAKHRVGFAAQNAKEGNWLFNNLYIPPMSDQVSKVYHYLAFLKRVGVSYAEDDLHFQIDRKRCLNDARPFFESSTGPFATLALGTSWESKDWVFEGYDQLVKQLQADTDVTVVLCGDRSQEELSKKIEEAAPRPLLNTVGKTDLVQLCGVLANSTVAIGPDTGPGHLSSLFEVPYIGLFGPTDPARVAPFRSESLAQVASVPCRPCWKRECPGLDRVCMRLLSVPKIAERARTLMPSA